MERAERLIPFFFGEIFRSRDDGGDSAYVFVGLKNLGTFEFKISGT